MKSVITGVGAFAALLLGVAPASSQPLGTFSWQLLPYCNVLTLTVSQVGGLFTMNGTDDQCGPPAAKASVSGLAFVNPSGSIGMGLTIVTPTAGAPVPTHLDISILIQTLGGTWRDSAGNSGNFFFATSRVPGGSPRPVTASGLPPGSVTVTQLAPGAVGAAQLAPGAVTGAAIADGSITAAKIADRPRAAFASAASLALPAADTVVLTLTLQAPANGRVIASASGSFAFLDNADTDEAACAITQATTVELAHRIVAGERVDPAAIQNVPIGVTRGFDVVAGPVTVNLVCIEYSGGVLLENPAMTVQFFPVP